MKTNGKIQNGPSLNQILNRGSSILGCSSLSDYQSKLARMDTDALYRHGMAEFGIKPSRSMKAREGFEKKCIAAFKEEMGIGRVNL
jgi:hypothetical protein